MSDETLTTIRYADDLTIGEVVELGEYTIDEAELVAFARQWDPQGFHVDREVAENGWFGGLIASGIHSIAVLQRLSVLNAYGTMAVIAGRNVRDVQFLRPVRPGDLLVGSMRVDDVVLDDRGRGLVTFTQTLADADGTPFLSQVAEVLVRRRPA
ncbi:MaoC/PaaZ C-terminal domain-containing protein [Rhodococcus triatomae]|nr:hypothetical protein G419_05737 [Rhodococcus triatomae BKS 15-14]